MKRDVEKYVVAVSGGIDSVALLHSLVNKRLKELNYQLPTTNYQLIVVHVDHGIREESGDDAEFVRKLAEKYGLPFERFRANIGVQASEAQARKVRYNFLRSCCKKYDAKLITAHHQDDVIETAIINIIRGTGWRGLSSLQTWSVNGGISVYRPLLTTPKSKLLEYAQENKLEWREDATNADQSYLRNYVRHTLVPYALKNSLNFYERLLECTRDVANVKVALEEELKQLAGSYRVSPDTYKIPRHPLIMWPAHVAKEILYYVLTDLDPDWHPELMHIERALLFSKSTLPQKTLEVSKHLFITSSTRHITFQRKP